MKKRETKLFGDGALGNLLDYSCYRSFLADYLVSEGLSYRAFAKRFGAYVSFPLLSKLLRTSTEGRFRGEVNMRPERLAALLKAMGLGTEEVRHLVLCRLRNDCAPGRYRYSSTYEGVLDELGKQVGADVDDRTGVMAALSALAPSRLRKVMTEINHQLEVEIARCDSDLKIQTLRSLKLET